MFNGNKGKIVLVLGVVLAMAVGVLVAIAAPWRTVAQPEQSDAQSTYVLEVPQSEPEVVEEVVVEEAPAAPLEFTVTGGGDMLIHMPVADSAWNGERWDFTTLMAPVADYISGADIAICNMETPVVPRDQQPSGYPIFGAPQDLVDDMAAVGWDGCSTSTNHSLDQGYSGVVHTLNSFDEAGMGHVGTSRNQAEAAAPQLYVVEGEDQSATVAHISSAHNLNGIPMPEEAPWAVQMIDADRLIAEATAAREAGADVVIASLHCCEVEYMTDPEEEQITLAQTLAASGVIDLVLSHHAHVPKTIDLLEGGPDGNGMWIAYGLGNFVSNQSTECCVEQSSSGLLAYFTFLKEEDQNPKIVDATWQVVTVDRFGGHRVYPLSAAGAEGSTISAEEAASRHAGIAAILEGSPATERTEAPTPSGNTVTVIPHTQ